MSTGCISLGQPRCSLSRSHHRANMSHPAGRCQSHTGLCTHCPTALAKRCWGSRMCTWRQCSHMSGSLCRIEGSSGPHGKSHQRRQSTAQGSWAQSRRGSCLSRRGRPGAEGNTLSAGGTPARSSRSGRRRCSCHPHASRMRSSPHSHPGGSSVRHSCCSGKWMSSYPKDWHNRPGSGKSAACCTNSRRMPLLRWCKICTGRGSSTAGLRHLSAPGTRGTPPCWAGNTGGWHSRSGVPRTGIPCPCRASTPEPRSGRSPRGSRRAATGG